MGKPDSNCDIIQGDQIKGKAVPGVTSAGRRGHQRKRQTETNKIQKKNTF